MLSGQLTGLWGPDLFFYGEGFSPFTMESVMRRSMYKILHIWGQIWMLDWDESEAFPKLQMGIMEEVLGVADKEIGTRSMRKRQEQFDQFYRTQQIYLVREHGLGIPYQAKDGAVEADSTGRTVYRACTAVWTN